MLQIAIKKGTARKSLFAGLLSCLLAAPVFTWAQGQLPGMVIFGDSLSDPGNAFAFLGAVSTPHDYPQYPFLVPDKPYAKGGQHFSNGATWIEQLATWKGMAVNANPAFRSANRQATNYAVGGARAYNHADSINLPQQVGQFLQDFGWAAPADALYFVAVGGNDLRDVAESGNLAIVQLALDSIRDNIVQLHGAGARKFVVWNAPKIAVTPAIRTLGAAAAAQVDGLTVQYNTYLAAYLDGLQALPGIQILRFDVYGKVAVIYGNGAAFGLNEVNAPCITPNVPPYACQNPDDYMFWDGIHPTKAVHALIAHEVSHLLGP